MKAFNDLLADLWGFESRYYSKPITYGIVLFLTTHRANPTPRLTP